MVCLGWILGACGPQVAVDDAAGGSTGDDGHDSCGSDGSSCEPPDESSTGGDDPGPATTDAPEPPSPTTGPPDPGTSTTTSPPPPDDPWDDCGTGGDDCCEVNPNFCDPSDFEPQIEGLFLFALSTTPSPELPLQYLATVEVVSYRGDVAEAQISLLPLTLDVGSTTEPREAYGDPIDVFAVIDDADLTFEIEIGPLSVDGVTNPITGSDMAMANVILSGNVLGPDELCGFVGGNIVSPIMAPLEGSTFAMIRVEDLGQLPQTFPLACS